MSVADSIAKPFREREIDVVGLALKTGLIITFAWAWMQILRPTKEIVEEVVEQAAGG